MREYGFELALCAHLERRGDRVVARQLGGGVHGSVGRVLDVVTVEPGPRFEERARLTDAAIPAAVLESDLGPGAFRDWRRVLGDGPGAERAVERACEVGYLERDRRRGREVVRQVARYPSDWFDRIVAVENKPDLADPGDLYEQVQFDASLALVDEVVVATRSHVTRAHRNRLPDHVGVWRFDPEAGELDVVVDPEPLPVDEPGIEPVDRRPGRTDVAVVSPAAKRRRRRRLAERAYGKGWRTFTLPPCAHVDPGGGPAPGTPMCDYMGRLVNPGVECGPACDGFSPSPPPAVDLRGEREARQPWVRGPPDLRREQASLDRY